MKVWTKIYAVTLAGFMGIFACPPSVAAVTYAGEKNGNIAFSQTVHDVPNVWLVSAKQNHMRQLTHFGADNPTWSPDGQKMLVVSLWGQLQMLDQQGRVITWLPFDPGSTDISPVWSSDGARVAFVRTQIDKGRTAVCSFSLRSRELNNVSGWSKLGGYRSPSWAPDNRRLVYEQFIPDQRTLFIKDTDYGHREKLARLLGDYPSGVTWSPSGKRILFHDSVDQVYTIWPDGSHRTVISDGDSHGAVWSPEGNRLAFVEDNGISLSETDGTVVQVYAGSEGRIIHMTWSPDGNQLAFIVAHDKISSITLLDVRTQTIKSIVQTTTQPSALSWQARKVGHDTKL